MNSNNMEGCMMTMQGMGWMMGSMWLVGALLLLTLVLVIAALIKYLFFLGYKQRVE